MAVDELRRLQEMLTSLKDRIYRLERAPLQQNMTVDVGNFEVLAPDGLYVLNSLAVGGNIDGSSLSISGTKSFRIEHPTRDGFWLTHGSTESPMSGTEYTGRVSLDANGEALVELPEYFEALNKFENRTVQVTPIGAPFPVGAGVVAGGGVEVFGEPNREVYWLVKAERRGADFEVEQERGVDNDDVRVHGEAYGYRIGGPNTGIPGDDGGPGV